MKNVRVRFAPSPTGYLHIGGARTALFNYLFAKHHDGKFILRIEDTDQKRFQQDALKEIYDSLKWLGLEWDEGPGKGGGFGPYIQSERADLYKKFAEVLIDKGSAYRCFCTPERLELLRKAQQNAKMQDGLGYDRHCRHLSQSEQQAMSDEGRPFVVRFKVPDGKSVVFRDLIRGNIEYNSDILDDLVLLKSDGLPTYHLANVVDDHLMEISHVLRGDEWIASTPRHILIYQALEWEPPHFAHMPVILSPEGGKLSKRKGAASVSDYKRSGYLPEALVNFLSLLGWSPGDDREVMTKDEIIEAFDLDRISPKASVLDEKKLEWMNGHYMASRSVDSLLPEVVPLWINMGWIESYSDANEAYLKSVVSLMKERSKKIIDLAHSSYYFFKDPEEYEAKAVKKRFKGDAPLILKRLHKELQEIDPFNQDTIEKLYIALSEELNLSAGKLIHPTRLAVTGVSFGAGLFEILDLIGQKAVVRRMAKAIAWLESGKGME